MYVNELQVRFRPRPIPAVVACEARLKLPADAVAAFMPQIGREVVEVCGILCLSIRGTLIAYHEVSRGTLNATLMHARDVYRTALLVNASAVIVGDNHPSGDVTPSADDLAVTARLSQAGQTGRH